MVLAGTVVVLLILTTGLFVAAEFAAVSARRSRLRRMAEDGNALAARMLPVVDDPHALDRYIAASQVGITVSSLVLGAYGQAAIAPRVSPLLEFAGMDAAAAASTAAITVLLALTMLSVILGELVPKSLALQKPTATALFTVVPMEWSAWIFGGFIAVLNGSGVFLLKLMRVPATGHRHVHSPEEIELLIAESRDGGLLEPREQVRLHRALRLGLRTARQLMVPRERLVALDAETAFQDVLRLAASSPYSRMPVYRGSLDTIVGILHTKDVVTRFVKGQPITMASLLRPVVRVPDTMAADRLLAFLREHRSHHAIVMDEAGAVAGLITLEDVLSELLGGVGDEFKGAQLRPIVLSDGRLRIPGALRLDQAAKLIGRNWGGEGQTFGSYIVSTLARVPEPGESFVLDGVDLEVEAVEGNTVGSIIAGIRPQRATRGDR